MGIASMGFANSSSLVWVVASVRSLIYGEVYLAAKEGHNSLISQRKLNLIADSESTNKELSNETNPNFVATFV